MKIVKFVVINTVGSCRDTIEGKEYNGILLETGECHPTLGLRANSPALVFTDEEGDTVDTYISTGNVKILEEV